MSYEVIGITVLWLFLYGYLIVASIDFGAGFFAYYAKITKQDHIINQIISRYLSPVWEVTNVFLVFFLWESSVFSRLRHIIMDPLYLCLQVLGLSC